MDRFRNIIGLISGIMLMLSSVAHSIVGWESIRTQLAVLPVGSDLTQGLKIAWIFGGMSMLVLGILLTMLFVKRLRGNPITPLPALIVGLGYLGFGIWALITTDYDPFNMIFVIPGLLMLFAGSGAVQAQSHLAKPVSSSA